MGSSTGPGAPFFASLAKAVLSEVERTELGRGAHCVGDAGRVKSWAAPADYNAILFTRDGGRMSIDNPLDAFDRAGALKDEPALPTKIAKVVGSMGAEVAFPGGGLALQILLKVAEALFDKDSTKEQVKKKYGGIVKSEFEHVETTKADQWRCAKKRYSSRLHMTAGEKWQETRGLCVSDRECFTK